MNILVTGATGFVGSALVKTLISKKISTTAIVRKISSELPNEIKQVVLKDISVLMNREGRMLSDEMESIDVVIHLAARVHLMNDDAKSPLDEFRKVNTNATLALARQAAMAGVKRFIFLSTIKVNGECNLAGLPFSEKDTCAPIDPYGHSKWEAEQGLLQIAYETGMEVVIIRPPLIYGPGVKGNFHRMLRWIDKGIPLPFGSVENKRSLLGVENLVSFIFHCLNHPKAANDIFLLSDGEDLSTAQLIQKLAKLMGRKPRLLPVPVSLMRCIAVLLGKRDYIPRLLGNLQIDGSKAKELLGWKPPVSIDEQLKKMLK